MSAAEEKITLSRIRAGLAWLTPLLFLLAALVAPAAPAASAKTPGVPPNRAWGNSAGMLQSRPIQTPQSLELQRENSIGRYDSAVGDTLAAESGVLENANYAQKTFSHAFSTEGTFAGRTVEDVAGALRSGVMKPAAIPIQYIERDGQVLILNTRSAQALEQAGIPRARWNAVNVTGNADAEGRLTRQLLNNNLTSQGASTVRPSGRR